MYDIAHESIDSPPDWVIEDDELLDEWFDIIIKEYNERREENYKEKIRGKSKNMITARNAQEVITIERPRKDKGDSKDNG